jgi:hypothetical protein
MFQFEKVQNSIPGYTGYENDNYLLVLSLPRKTSRTSSRSKGTVTTFQVLIHHDCLGYQGFVPGIKSENLYGKTFGKTTLLSST